jgi:hypothetical protein
MKEKAERRAHSALWSRGKSRGCSMAGIDQAANWSLAQRKSKLPKCSISARVVARGLRRCAGLESCLKKWPSEHFKPSSEEGFKPALKDLGISEKQSHEWQKLAALAVAAVDASSAAQ